jgi:hypothetical protein
MYKGNHPRGGASQDRPFYAQPHGNSRSFNRSASEVPRVVASALKVKNFRRLVDAIGEEQLAVKLDLSLPRIKEIAEGVNLSNETAYHIESTLGLQVGFIDQVNPVLTPEDILRLNSVHQEPKQDDPPISSSLKLVQPRSEKPTENPLAQQEPPMPKQAKPMPPQNTAGTPATSEDILREVRRVNLQLLTTRPGTKTQLSRLTGLSAANVSHRLHGNKIFDRDTGVFFGDKLGLPEGWFEVPQTEESIPPGTLNMLLDKSSEPLPSSLRAKPASRKRVASVKAPALTIPSNLAPTQGAGTLALSGSSLGRAQGESTGGVPAKVSPANVAKPEAVPSAIVHAVAPAPSRLAPSGKVGPIVTALLQTLTLKAQEGRLTEEQALQMLVDAASV